MTQFLTCHPERSAQRKSKDLLLLLPLLVFLLATITFAQTKPPASAGFSGQAVYDLTQQFIAAAPQRYVQSPGHLAAEAFIKSHFAPEIAKGNFETDSFTAVTPIGQIPMRNYIAKFPGKKEGVIVLASHYETNYPLKDTDFVGANDGACTSAFLIEMGNYLRAHPPQGLSVWLLFDDGEEAVANPPYEPGQWSSSNSLYGTRHLAAKWYSDGTLAKIKAFIILDMIGDKSLDIDREANSTPWLEDILMTAAKNTNHLAAISKDQPLAIEDDHLPFKQRGVPVLDLIDYNYGPHTQELPDGYHHTAQDTLDKISAKSLQTTGDLILEIIRLINLH
jgi:glutaminyl-peptide cyclotransferase